MILAAYGAIFIKDSIDAKNPEKSLPIISVSTGYTPPYVVRAGYTWNFGFKTVRSPYLSAGDVPMMVTDCRPGETVVINFSAVKNSVFFTEICPEILRRIQAAFYKRRRGHLHGVRIRTDERTPSVVFDKIRYTIIKLRRIGF